MIKKAILIVLYICFHLLLFRDVRTTVFAKQTQYLASEGIHQIDGITVSKWGKRVIYFNYSSANYEKVWRYKLPFGFFFLLGIIGLILSGAKRRFYLSLILIHLLTIIISSIVFSYLVYQSTWMFAISDLLSRYLIPLSSLGLIPLAIIDKRNLLHENKA